MIHKNRSLNPSRSKINNSENLLSLETAAALIQTNLEHARHIESQRMFLALGYFAAMYALLPSALSDLFDPNPPRGTAQALKPFLSSGIAALISFLCLLMTLKWNTAFGRWIGAAQTTADTWAAEGDRIRSRCDPTYLFGFKKEIKNTPDEGLMNKARNRLIRIGVSKAFDRFYGISTGWWLFVTAYNIAVRAF